MSFALLHAMIITQMHIWLKYLYDPVCQKKKSIILIWSVHLHMVGPYGYTQMVLDTRMVQIHIRFGKYYIKHKTIVAPSILKM